MFKGSVHLSPRLLDVLTHASDLHVTWILPLIAPHSEANPPEGIESRLTR